MEILKEVIGGEIIRVSTIYYLEFTTLSHDYSPFLF
jgi:hypothetical protein